ncbi:dTDP-4-dehydrorhamnose 3,5-epimerase [Dongia deserti]|uniref:dTDP-4-dehydrorhamnose 3,5-epimerase n=1 Tax=Dongia deserti TaxID=2268030 RepID=UPI000E648256|nr:dTDP-4-dehydrorhamnose 3,5-epimerase [Dongia deserti]
MQITELALPDVKLVQLKVHGDNRGFFMETFREADWRSILRDRPFIQDNQSHSAPAGTVRGLHYQMPPFAQAKLVQALRGRILDVAVDLRRGSPSFGRHIALELAAGDGKQMFVPEGFAHGFMTLEPDSMVAYKVTAPYEPKSERGIAWDDPDLAIVWPAQLKASATLSPRDRQWPCLKDATDLF